MCSGSSSISSSRRVLGNWVKVLWLCIGNDRICTQTGREREQYSGACYALSPAHRSHQCQWNHWPTPKGEWRQEGGCTRRWMVSPRIYRVSSTSSRSRQRVSRSHFISIPIPKSSIYPPPFRLPRHQRILLALQCGVGVCISCVRIRMNGNSFTTRGSLISFAIYSNSTRYLSI